MKPITKWEVFLVLFTLVHLVAAAVLSVGLISLLAIYEAAVGAWAFVIWYGTRYQWRASLAGRQVMSTMVFIALLTTVSVLPTNSPGWLLRWVACLLLIGMVVLVLNQLWLLWQFSKDNEREEAMTDENHIVPFDADEDWHPDDYQTPDYDETPEFETLGHDAAEKED